MNIKKISFFSLDLVLLSINVLFYIPRMVLSVLNKEKNYIIFIPLFLSILAFNFVPPYEYDLYRHFEVYNNIKLGNNSTHYDLFLNSLFQLGVFFNLHSGYIPFFSCFIIYYSISYVFYDMYRDVRLSSVKYLTLYFVFIISVPIILYTGVRFSTGIAFFILGVYLLSKGKVTKGSVLLILSSICHFSMIMVILVYLVSILISKFKIKYTHKVLYMLLCMLLSFNNDIVLSLIIYIINLFNELVGINIDINTYVLGRYGAERSSSFNSTGLIIYNLSVYLKLVLILIFYFSFIKLNDRLSIFNMILSGVCVILIPYATLYGRYSQILVIMLLISIMSSFADGVRNWKLYIIITGFLLYFSFFRMIEIKENYSVFINSYSNVFGLSFLDLIYNISI